MIRGIYIVELVVDDSKSRVVSRFSSARGETLTETLVSILISSLAILMLGTAITTSVSIIMKSKEAMNTHYANENALVNGDGPIKINNATIIFREVNASGPTGNVVDAGTTNPLTVYVDDPSGQVPIARY